METRGASVSTSERRQSPFRLGVLLQVALPFLMAAAYFAVTRVAQMDGDSPCYLQWCAKRTSVYPMFLNLVDRDVLLPVQLLLFAVAIAALALVAFRYSGTLIFSGMLTAGMLANPYLWQLQGSIMSEAITTPLLVVLLILTLQSAMRGRPLLFGAASLVAGIMTATRPSCLPLLIIPLAVLWLSGQRSMGMKIRLTALCVVLWLVPVVADRAVTQAVLGNEQSSLAGRHVFAKAALIDAPPLDRSDMSLPDRRLADVLERDYAPVRRVVAPLTGNVRDVVRLNYEVCFQYACTDAATRDVGLKGAALDEALYRVGLARLRQNLGAYLDLSVDEFRGEWLLHPRKHPTLARDYNAFLRSAAPLPFQYLLGEEGQIVRADQQKSLYRVNRAAFLAIAVIIPILLSVLVYLLTTRPRRPLVIASFSALAGVIAVQVFTAMFGVGIPRYTMGLWPAIVFAFVTAAFALFERYRETHLSRG